MKARAWVLGTVVVVVGALYGLDYLYQRSVNRVHDQIDAQVTQDQSIRAVCKEAASRTLGVPVLDWDDTWTASPYTHVEKTSTGYRAKVAADTGGTIHVFTCYIGNDMRTLQQIAKG